MIDYIKGEITELTPTAVVLETSGVGYYIQITLPTYSALQNDRQSKLFIYESIREDALLLFGFMNQTERQLFLLLISVSGIGANTARMIMSSYSVNELQDMIGSGNVTALNAIKGIGSKTAQRIIVDLKDKIYKVTGISTGNNLSSNAPLMGETGEEAVSALVMLGFTASASQKVVTQILKSEQGLRVEQIIKQALKML
ncbi:MAG: Holliday junction branch migration protein RuvA [Paludibacter sp.]|nr:Holliday junction branch migration protein RuvA [Paludibacter sp.]